MVRVRVTSVLSRYTGGEKEVQISGESVKEILNVLDERFPGIKFRFVDEHQRIRPHMCIYRNGVLLDNLDQVVGESDEIYIVHALSGG